MTRPDASRTPDGRSADTGEETDEPPPRGPAGKPDRTSTSGESAPTTRLAPSPTGALHLGNARTFVLTWLHVRRLGGRVLLRIDDLDGPRVKPERAREALQDLRWLGLDWEPQPILIQSERSEVYEEALDDLRRRDLVYPCTCTRSEIAEAASAPHGPGDGVYPGTCRGRFENRAEAREATGRQAALRFVVPDREVEFHDELHGTCRVRPAAECGDFPVRKRDGTCSYQLATVLDDHESGVDLVIRGDDLLPSTARQILLQEALDLPRPSYLHLPLVVGPDGRRLAKRHGDTTLRHLRELGWSAERVLGWIAGTAGLAEWGTALSLDDLLDRYRPERLTTEPVVVAPEELLA